MYFVCAERNMTHHQGSDKKARVIVETASASSRHSLLLEKKAAAPHSCMLCWNSVANMHDNGASGRQQYHYTRVDQAQVSSPWCDRSISSLPSGSPHKHICLFSSNSTKFGFYCLWQQMGQGKCILSPYRYLYNDRAVKHLSSKRFCQKKKSC